MVPGCWLWLSHTDAMGHLWYQEQIQEWAQRACTPFSFVPQNAPFEGTPKPSSMGCTCMGVTCTPPPFVKSWNHWVWLFWQPTCLSRITAVDLKDRSVLRISSAPKKTEKDCVAFSFFSPWDTTTQPCSNLPKSPVHESAVWWLGYSRWHFAELAGMCRLLTSCLFCYLAFPVRHIHSGREPTAPESRFSLMPKPDCAGSLHAETIVGICGLWLRLSKLFHREIYVHQGQDFALPPRSPFSSLFYWPGEISGFTK